MQYQAQKQRKKRKFEQRNLSEEDMFEAIHNHEFCSQQPNVDREVHLGNRKKSLILIT